MSTASRRRSRKPDPAFPPMPSESTPPPSDNKHGRLPSSPAAGGSPRPGRRSIHDRPPTPPGPEGVGGVHKRKMSTDIPHDSPLPSLPPTFASMNIGPDRQPPPVPRKSLDVPSTSRPTGRGGKRLSAAPSLTPSTRYAGSLYDMYLGEQSCAGGKRLPQPG